MMHHRILHRRHYTASHQHLSARRAFPLCETDSSSFQNGCDECATILETSAQLGEIISHEQRLLQSKLLKQRTSCHVWADNVRTLAHICKTLRTTTKAAASSCWHCAGKEARAEHNGHCDSRCKDSKPKARVNTIVYSIDETSRSHEQ